MEGAPAAATGAEVPPDKPHRKARKGRPKVPPAKEVKSQLEAAIAEPTARSVHAALRVARAYLEARDGARPVEKRPRVEERA